MARYGRPDPDAAVTRLPERTVNRPAGAGRGVVRLREMSEDKVLEPVRRERERHLCCLPVREVAVARRDPALQPRRVRPTPEPVGVVVRFENQRLGPPHAPQDFRTRLAEVGSHRRGALAVRDV